MKEYYVNMNDNTVVARTRDWDIERTKMTKKRERIRGPMAINIKNRIDRSWHLRSKREQTKKLKSRGKLTLTPVNLAMSSRSKTLTIAMSSRFFQLGKRRGDDVRARSRRDDLKMLASRPSRLDYT